MLISVVNFVALALSAKVRHATSSDPAVVAMLQAAILIKPPCSIMSADDLSPLRLKDLALQLHVDSDVDAVLERSGCQRTTRMLQH